MAKDNEKNKEIQAKDSVKNEKNKRNQTKEEKKVVKKSKKGMGFLLIIWIIVVILGFSYYNLEKSSQKINILNIERKVETKKVEGKFEQVKLYIPNSDFTKLKILTEEMPVYYQTRDKIYKITEKNLEILFESKLIATKDIEINNIYISNDLVYINFGKGILDLKEPSRKNILAIYGIVDSLTEIPQIKRVKFLVENKEVDGNFRKIYNRNIGI